MARPAKYASAAERQKAYRERYEVIEMRVTKETGETLTSLAKHLGTPRTELINSLIIFALLNRNWATLGLFGKRLPYSKNPVGHLNALELRLSNERIRLRDAKSPKEKALRKVWIAQIEKEIAQEKAFLGRETSLSADEMTDDEIFEALKG